MRNDVYGKVSASCKTGECLFNQRSAIKLVNKKHAIAAKFKASHLKNSVAWNSVF